MMSRTYNMLQSPSNFIISLYVLCIMLRTVLLTRSDYGSHVWAFVSIVQSRFILRTQVIKGSRRKGSIHVWNKEENAFAMQSFSS